MNKNILLSLSIFLSINSSIFCMQNQQIIKLKIKNDPQKETIIDISKIIEDIKNGKKLEGDYQNIIEITEPIQQNPQQIQKNVKCSCLELSMCTAVTTVLIIFAFYSALFGYKG